MSDQPLWQQAASFAARAHLGQVRKDGQTPYFAHPARVTLTITCVFGFTDETIIAAALLHDTIEDTIADYDDLHERFGKEVADIVACLTKDMRLIEPEREAAYDQQLAAGPWQARLIKLADVYDNLCDVADAAAWRKQIARTQRALRLTERDAPLTEARRIVENLMESTESRN